MRLVTTQAAITSPRLLRTLTMSPLPDALLLRQLLADLDERLPAA